MSGQTKIEWTDVTWNPLRGCTRVSEGCRHCYAERVAARFSGPGQPYEGLATRGSARWTGKVRLVEEHLTDPLHWRKPRRVFVNSMSDLFHEAVPDEWIDRIFAVMALATRHTFQVLTKRPERMREYMTKPMEMHQFVSMLQFAADLRPNLQMDDFALSIDCGEKILPNVWLGVSVEDQATADARIPALLSTPAAVRFVSAEPLLGPVNLMGRGWIGCFHGGMDGRDAETDHARCRPTLDWIIVGGESGPVARPLDVAWIRSIRDQCRAAGVPVFVKQLGAFPCVEHEVGTAKGSSPVGLILRNRKGGDPAEWPEELRVREFPEVGS